MKKTIILLLLLLILPSKAAAQSNQLQVSPVRSDYNARPGDTVRVPISIKNPTNKVITVTVIPRDFEASPNLDGEPRILESRSAYGISNWLTDANLDKKLNILGDQTITYTAVFRVPNSTTDRTYFGLITFRVEDSAISTSIGSIVFITVGNPSTTITVSDLKFAPSDEASKPHGVFTTTIHNPSEGLMIPNLSLRITDSSGKEIAQLTQDSDGSVLPKSSRNFTFTPKTKLPEDHLTATLAAADQNNNTADKSIQLDRSPAPVQQATAAEAATPKQSGALIPLLLTFGIILLAATFVFYKMQKRKKPIEILDPTTELTQKNNTNEKYTNQS